MDGAYLREEKPKSLLRYIIAAAFLILLAAGIFFLTKRNSKFISPIPPKASFEVIFYTPSPLPATPSSTPSATLKPAKKTPSNTPSAKATPTAKAVSPTVQPTSKASPSPTGETTPTKPTT